MYWYQYELSSSYFEILHPNKKKVWWYGGRANLQTFEQNFCRNEVKPVFIEFQTYRWLEHCGPNFDNNIGYRSEKEFQKKLFHPKKHLTKYSKMPLNLKCTP